MHRRSPEERPFSRSGDAASCCEATGQPAELLSASSSATGAMMPPAGGLRGAWRAGDDQPTPAINSSEWRSRLPLCLRTHSSLPTCSAFDKVQQDQHAPICWSCSVLEGGKSQQKHERMQKLPEKKVPPPAHSISNQICSAISHNLMIVI